MMHKNFCCSSREVSLVKINVRLVDKKSWDAQNFLHLYQAFNCQDKVKIILTFTISVDSCNAESN
jgi:hypothetical protein